ncbi:MAG: hypothetical protein ACOYVF_02075 [Candidatus Zixiibacteriota bacterium]
MRSKIFLVTIVFGILLLSCSKYYNKYYGLNEETKKEVNDFFVSADINCVFKNGFPRKPVKDSLFLITLFVGSDEPRYDSAYKVFSKIHIDTLLIEMPAVKRIIKITPEVVILHDYGVHFGFGHHIITEKVNKITLKFTVVYDAKDGEGFNKNIVMELTKQTGYNRDWAPYLLD